MIDPRAWRAIAPIAFPFVVALSATIAIPARAGEPAAGQCISAHEKALELKKSQKLRDARSSLVTCAADTCPAEVRSECAEQLASLKRLMPTIVFAAKDDKGNDRSDVHVTMDGQPLVDKLDGHAVEVDPGEHTFRFEARGASPIEKKLIVSEAETDRHEHIVLSAGEAAPAGPEPSPEHGTNPGTAQRAAGLIVSGVGIVGIGVGAIFGLRASSKWSDAKNDCGTGCGPDASAQTEKAEAQSAATVSTIAFAAGGVAVALGVVLFVTAPKRAAAPSAALRVTPVFDGSSGRVSLGGAF